MMVFAFINATSPTWGPLGDELGFSSEWWCAIFFALQLVMFVLGFEETKFTHVETQEGRQGSVTTVPAVSGHIHGDYKQKAAEPPIEADEKLESRSDRNMSVVHINPNIPRKTYLQKLSLTTTSPGSCANNGIYGPEVRFYTFVPFIPFQLAGAWWFGYALNNGWDWSQVAVAYGLCNFGSAPLQSLALTYMLDAYGEILGDALTALTFVRNTFSTIFVFAMPAWIAGVGMTNAFNTIGAIGVVILSFAIYFIWKGKHLRVKCAKVY
ncbi:uncharacterized protein MYCFIDRAFT_83626, partial [Pseudocercospora fijiensis CIRAD86]